MDRRRLLIPSRLGTLALLVQLASMACAPATPQSSTTQSPAAPGEAPRALARPNQTLVVAVRLEPVSLADKAVTPTGTGVAFVTRVFNAELDQVDNEDRAVPYLAEALPQLNTDTWKVSADGKMETTYQLKPNLTWHDGQPLTADDFAFALKVYKTPELGVGGEPHQPDGRDPGAGPAHGRDPLEHAVPRRGRALGERRQHRQVPAATPPHPGTASPDGGAG